MLAYPGSNTTGEISKSPIPYISTAKNRSACTSTICSSTLQSVRKKKSHVIKGHTLAKTPARSQARSNLLLAVVPCKNCYRLCGTQCLEQQKETTMLTSKTRQPTVSACATNTPGKCASQGAQKANPGQEAGIHTPCGGTIKNLVRYAALCCVNSTSENPQHGGAPAPCIHGSLCSQAARATPLVRNLKSFGPASRTPYHTPPLGISSRRKAIAGGKINGIRSHRTAERSTPRAAHQCSAKNHPCEALQHLLHALAS